MTKKGILILSAAATVLILAAVILSVNNRPGFTGSRVKNPDRYTCEFTRWNQTDSHSLTLKKGDRLAVRIALSKGSMDLLIRSESGKQIYKGDGQKDGAFELEIPADGTYVITVSARKAAGTFEISAPGK